MNWKHYVALAAAAALPPLANWLQNVPQLSWASLAHEVASLVLVGLAAAMKGLGSPP